MKTNHPHRNRTLAFATVLACISISIGCEPAYDATVSGTVTLDGEIIDRGTVVFHAAGSGPSAHGQIDSSGHYSLSVGADPRLPPGDYVITVMAREPSVPSKVEDAPPMPGAQITPAKYGDPQTTDLNQTVNQGQNTIDLELKSN